MKEIQNDIRYYNELCELKEEENSSLRAEKDSMKAEINEFESTIKVLEKNILVNENEMEDCKSTIAAGCARTCTRS